MSSESKTVTKTTMILRHLSESDMNFSNPSTIFIAGNAINTSMTMEKTRVSTRLSTLVYLVIAMNKGEFLV